MDATDCLIIGAGPAGLTAAIYLRRFRRSVTLVADGASRARLIPSSHNFPGFADGISGVDFLARLEDHAARYDVAPITDTITHLTRHDEGFRARGATQQYAARTVIVATGVEDIEPDIPDAEGETRKSAVRHCPICDGYEVIGRRIAVIGRSSRAVREALFLRHYTRELLLFLTNGYRPDAQEAQQLQRAGIAILQSEHYIAVHGGERQAQRLIGLKDTNGKVHEFETLYSALGTRPRGSFLAALGIATDHEGGIVTDAHQCTSVSGLYAIGDIVSALNQITVAVGHAAIAATHIHNTLRTQAIFTAPVPDLP